MNRNVLFIPLEEIVKHFSINDRQDIKIVAPNVLSDELFEILKKKGKILKPEIKLKGNRWKRSYKTKPNKICESVNFLFEIPYNTKGLFSISFANGKAVQEEHYHKHHTEIYYSEQRISGYYRKLNQKKINYFELTTGGLALFQANIIHHLELNGLTLIIEIPSLEDDRFIECNFGITSVST